MKDGKAYKKTKPVYYNELQDETIGAVQQADCTKSVGVLRSTRRDEEIIFGEKVKLVCQ